MNKPKGTTLRQIAIPNEAYSNIEQLTFEHNQLHNLVKRSKKFHIQNMIPQLVQDGIDIRKGKMYKHPKIEGDATAEQLYGAAQAAIDRLHTHLNK